jgi:hypothetical protein
MLFGVQWYYWLILAIAIIGAIFAWAKALKTSKERRERMKKEAAIWKRDYELREKYTVLTDDKLMRTEETELLHGVAMNIQVLLETAQNMNDAFLNLPDEKKYIYLAEYFDEDAKKSLSTYFKNNGAPLLPYTEATLKALGCTKYSEIIAPLFPMYDDESEVSVDYNVIAKVNEEFASVYDSDEFCRLCAKYIKENKNIFLS